MCNCTLTNGFRRVTGWRVLPIVVVFCLCLFVVIIVIVLLIFKYPRPLFVCFFVCLLVIS